MAWRLLAWAAGTACRFGDAAEASRHAVEHARRAGDVRQERRAATEYAVRSRSARRSSTRRSTAARRPSSRSAATGSPRASSCRCWPASTRCRASSIMRARSPRAAGALRGARARDGEGEARDGGGEHRAARRRPRRRRARASGRLRRARRRGEKYLLSTVAGFLAQTLLEQGALDEASDACERSRELTTEADIATQGLWRYVRGRILARQGAYAEAEEITREALGTSTPTDAIVYQIECNVALGEALAAGGPGRGGARGLRGRAAARRDERRRRDPQRRPPPPRGSRRRLGDDVGNLAHKVHGPFVLALAMSVQILLGPFGALIETTQPFGRSDRVRSGTTGAHAVVEHLRDRLLALQRRVEDAEIVTGIARVPKSCRRMPGGPQFAPNAATQIVDCPRYGCEPVRGVSESPRSSTSTRVEASPSGS